MNFTIILINICELCLNIVMITMIHLNENEQQLMKNSKMLIIYIRNNIPLPHYLLQTIMNNHQYLLFYKLLPDKRKEILKAYLNLKITSQESYKLILYLDDFLLLQLKICLTLFLLKQYTFKILQFNNNRMLNLIMHKLFWHDQLQIKVHQSKLLLFKDQ